MSENTKIEWATHTFNPWEGCQKVGPGCDHCYAESRNARFAGGTAINWGPGAPRRRTSAANWAKPLAWNAAHDAYFAEHGHRQRVFCASLADVFDNAVDREWRDDLATLILRTPNLDWLLLTKRIGNAGTMLGDMFLDGPPENVWLGATIVNQEEADRDIPKLLAVPTAKQFLSMEPLLGPVDIGKYVAPWTCSNCQHWGSEADSGPCKCADCDIESVYDDSIGSDRCPQCGKDDGTSSVVARSCPSCERSGDWDADDGFRFDSEKPSLLDWVILGGESGPNARPMHPDWARSLRDQCAAAGVPFFFKQWGEWSPFVNEAHYTHGGKEAHAHAWVDADTSDHGKCWLIDDDGSWSNWTGNPRKLPDGDEDDNGSTLATSICVMGHHGKKAAGRLLDGRTWNGFPV